MRLAFIGAGKHTQCVHLPNYACLPDVKIVGIADVDLSLATRIASRYQANAYASHRELIDKEKPDALVVTLPAIPPAEAVVGDVVRSGIPSIVEKPLSWSVPAAQGIVALQKQTGTPMVVGYHKRSDPAAMYAKEQIERCLASGAMGKMTYARMHVSLAGDWSASAYRDAIRTPIPAAATPARRTDDRDPISDAAREKYLWTAGTHSHNFDLMRYLIGGYKLTYIERTGTLMVVTSDTGIPAIFEFSPYQSTRDWREYAIVYFERGYVRFDLPAPLANHRAGTAEVFFDPGDGSTPTTTTPVFPFRSAMESQAANFIRFVQGQDHTLCCPNEALAALVLARDFAVAITT